MLKTSKTSKNLTYFCDKISNEMRKEFRMNLTFPVASYDYEFPMTSFLKKKILFSHFLANQRSLNFLQSKFLNLIFSTYGFLTPEIPKISLWIFFFSHFRWHYLDLWLKRNLTVNPELYPWTILYTKYISVHTSLTPPINPIIPITK